MVRIMNCISEEYKTLTLSGLVDKFHYSERQMMRVLKEYTGENFGDLIRNIKSLLSGWSALNEGASR